jgi:hypothetical protein
MIIMMMMALNTYFAMVYFLRANVGSGGSSAHGAKVGPL